MEIKMRNRDLKITVATAGDSRIRSLARHSGRSHLPGDKALIAERHGTSVAAISLTSGTVVRNSRTASAGAASLLRFHRYRILRQGGQTGAARSLLRRGAHLPGAAGSSLGTREAARC
jgi:hypothetical protein